jgi:hypothetical protein
VGAPTARGRAPVRPPHRAPTDPFRAVRRLRPNGLAESVASPPESHERRVGLRATRRPRDRTDVDGDAITLAVERDRTVHDADGAQSRHGVDRSCRARRARGASDSTRATPRWLRTGHGISRVYVWHLGAVHASGGGVLPLSIRLRGGSHGRVGRCEDLRRSNSNDPLGDRCGPRDLGDRDDRSRWGARRDRSHDRRPAHRTRRSQHLLLAPGTRGDSLPGRRG